MAKKKKRKKKTETRKKKKNGEELGGKKKKKPVSSARVTDNKELLHSEKKKKEPQKATGVIAGSMVRRATSAFLTNLANTSLVRVNGIAGTGEKKKKRTERQIRFGDHTRSTTKNERKLSKYANRVKKKKKKQRANWKNRKGGKRDYTLAAVVKKKKRRKGCSEKQKAKQAQVTYM